MIIQGNRLTKNFGGLPLFEAIDFQIEPQEKVGLIGQNGTGKSTLFKIILGEEGMTEGTLSQQKGTTIGCLPQIFPESAAPVTTYLQESFTVIQDLRQTLHYLERQMTDPNADLTKLLIRYDNCQQAYEESGGYQLEDRIQSMLKGLGLAEKAEVAVAKLSGGQRLRVELIKLLLQEPDLLLLDEPTNHLDGQGIAWLENFLKASKQAVLVISHDRAFLDHVVTRILEIEDGKLFEYPGNYSYYAHLKQQRREELQKNYELQQKEIQRLQLMVRRYRQWGNESDNEKFFRKAKEIERRVTKIDQIRPPQNSKKRLEDVKQATRSGTEVVVAENLGMIRGERLLFSDSNFTIYRGQRLALVGKNGSGKTTLIKLLLGELIPDEGVIRLGASIKLGYLPQTIVFERPDDKLLDFAQAITGNTQTARRLLAHYGFYADDVIKRIKDLSGGEQVRLQLLKLMQNEINFLILDEPTNHMDITMREEIEALLAEFTGTLLVVTHDRYFLAHGFDHWLEIRDQQVIKRVVEK